MTLHFREGRIDVSPLITHRFPFEKAQEAFTLAVERHDRPIKVLLDFGAETLVREV